jgi:MFS family permease
MSLAPSDVKSRSGTAGPKADTIPQKSKAHFGFGGKGPALGAATVLMLMFMGATLPGPLYLIYRDELHFSQVTLTLIYAVYFASAVLTAFFLGRLSDQVGRGAAVLFAIGVSLISTVLFVFADSIPLLYLARVLSGFGIPLAAGAGTAWVGELCDNRCTGASLTAGFTLAGLGLGPFLAGILAQFTREPLTLPFLVLMVLALAAAVITLLVPETVKRPVRRLRELSLRPRIGVPRALIAAFTAPAITAFATFSLLGFYSALTPSLLEEALHLHSHAISGGIIFELYAVAALVLVLTQWLSARAAMLAGLALLIPALALLALAPRDHSLPLLLVGSAVGGAAVGLSYRGSLQLVNELAPGTHRAEVVSTFLMFCYLGVSIPVVGIALLSAATTPIAAETAFAAIIAAFALFAISADLRLRKIIRLNDSAPAAATRSYRDRHRPQGEHRL